MIQQWWPSLNRTNGSVNFVLSRELAEQAYWNRADICATLYQTIMYYYHE